MSLWNETGYDWTKVPYSDVGYYYQDLFSIFFSFIIWLKVFPYKESPYIEDFVDSLEVYSEGNL